MMSPRVLFAVGLSAFATLAIAQPSEQKSENDHRKSYYLIGNSLTWDTIPSRLDGHVQWHVDCGKNLAYIKEHHTEPCVGTSTLWPTALRNTQYDYVSVQPHYGTTIQQDVDVISGWLELQPNAVFVIHTGWARHAQLAEEAADQDADGTLTHSDAYFGELLKQLRAKHPKRKFVQTRAMSLLHEVADDIAAGKAPLKSIEQLYRDKIHMTTTAGRYLMHNAMRQAFGQPLTDKGFEKVDPELKKYLHGLLSEPVISRP